MKPNEEGLFFNVPGETYHADMEHAVPSLSASILKRLIEDTPRHALWSCRRLCPKAPIRHRPLWDRGGAAHALTLRSQDDVAVLAFNDYRTAAAGAARDAAYAAGKIPVLDADYAELLDMIEAQQEQLDALEGGNPFAEGSPEVVMRWLDEFVVKGTVYKVWCRARLDWWNPEIENLYDLKSTTVSANPAEWTRSGMRGMWGQGAPYQACFYRRGIRRLAQLGVLKSHDPDFLFVLCESVPPYGLSLVSVPSDILVPYSDDSVDQRVLSGMMLWRDCLENGEWPGYDPSVYIAKSSGRRAARPQWSPEWRGGKDQAAPSGHLDSEDIAAGL